MAVSTRFCKLYTSYGTYYMNIFSVNCFKCPLCEPSKSTIITKSAFYQAVGNIRIAVFPFEGYGCRWSLSQSDRQRPKRS